MTISMDKQYTSNGKPVRILCTDRPCNKSVVTMDEDGCIGTFTLEGKWLCSEDSSNDLKEVWTPKCGELCYFWEDGYSRIVVDVFQKKRELFYIDSLNSSWQYCAPFDGTLPEGFVK